jgi:uncharacterized paraquat-inducible protein A
MSIDPAIIARRRYTARTLIRVAVLLLAGVFFYKLLSWFASLASYAHAGDALSSMFGFASLLWLVLVAGPWAAAAVTVYLLERRLVAWLVPPSPRYRCPACDYDTRYVTDERCPECGVELNRA